MMSFTPEQLIKFKKSQPLFDRIKKRLSSFNAMNLIDDGDFYKHVKYMIEHLGVGVYKECDAFFTVEKFKTYKLPPNFKTFAAAFSCNRTGGPTHFIDEQPGFVIYNQTEISNVVKDTCCVKCCTRESADKIVVKTIIEGTETTCNYGGLCLLELSGDLRSFCEDNSPNIGCVSPNKISVDINSDTFTTSFSGNIYFNYWGLPLDEDNLPMIPDVEDIEKAIEYFILVQLFEDLYFNSSVTGVATFLEYAKREYDQRYLPDARAYAVTPSFQRQLRSIRKLRRRQRIMFQYDSDKTTIR